MHTVSTKNRAKAAKKLVKLQNKLTRKYDNDGQRTQGLSRSVSCNSLTLKTKMLTSIGEETTQGPSRSASCNALALQSKISTDETQNCDRRLSVSKKRVRIAPSHDTIYFEKLNEEHFECIWFNEYDCEQFIEDEIRRRSGLGIKSKRFLLEEVETGTWATSDESKQEEKWNDVDVTVSVSVQFDEHPHPLFASKTLTTNTYDGTSMSNTGTSYHKTLGKASDAINQMKKYLNCGTPQHDTWYPVSHEQDKCHAKRMEKILMVAMGFLLVIILCISCISSRADFVPWENISIARFSAMFGSSENILNANMNTYKEETPLWVSSLQYCG